MTITWLAKNSLLLDAGFLRVSPWSADKKLYFILIKYFLILKHFFVPFKLGESQVIFSGRKIYYDVRYGIAGYQSMMTRHQYLLRLAKVKGIKTVIDVGANVGFFSLVARELYPRAKIYAFEPAPITYSCLKNNFTGDKNTTTLEMGLSDKPGTAQLQFDPDLSAVSTITSNGQLKIKLTTLDKFIATQKLKRIDLLKIDTETYELHVLKGAPKTLAKTRFLHLEATIEDNHNYTFTELLRPLSTPKCNFQLIAFRSYTDTSIDKATVFDLLFENVLLNK